MLLINNLQKSIIKHQNRNAFCISNIFYSYKELAIAISKIRKSIRLLEDELEKNIGVVTNDDLETYAAILALWFEGKAYVPLNPGTPEYRNKNIIDQADLKTILDSSDKTCFEELTVINTKKLEDTEIDLNPRISSNSDLAYILFTSGTTGVPKGVPITRANVSGFIDAFLALGYNIDETDRFLQMFDLTFDLSVMSYLVPILKGACIYTIPKEEIKYSYIYQLMDEQNLTVALMVPSMLHYLRPYFEEIHCPAMKYSLFCGEALPLDITKEWGQCLPNAKIVNMYGPTEDTIFCTNYTFDRHQKNKAYNGVLCIGKAMKGTQMIIVDNNNEALPDNEKGELCLGGVQLTPGYWKNEEKNKESFFHIEYEGNKTKFYKTGDLCYRDEDGDFMYVGRIDFQTKVQGFRIELSEVELYAKQCIEKTNLVAIAFTNEIGNTEIGLVIESLEFDTNKLIDSMKSKMPSYMIPTRIKFIKDLPLNVNGKIDRKATKKMFL